MRHIPHHCRDRSRLVEGEYAELVQQDLSLSLDLARDAEQGEVLGLGFSGYHFARVLRVCCLALHATIDGLDRVPTQDGLPDISPQFSRKAQQG